MIRVTTWTLPRALFIVTFFVCRRYKGGNDCWCWSGWPPVFGGYYRAPALFSQIQAKERFVEVLSFLC